MTRWEKIYNNGLFLHQFPSMTSSWSVFSVIEKKCDQGVEDKHVTILNKMSP